MPETIILKGDQAAQRIKEQVRGQIEQFKGKGIVPHLSVVVASSDQAVSSYVKSKKKLGEELGVNVEVVQLNETVNQQKLEEKLTEFSKNPTVHGIILEAPLYDHLDFFAAEKNIDPKKDVDGLTPTNLGLVLSGREDEAILSATPQACIMLAQTQGSLTGKNVVLVGWGKTVGRPLTAQLLNLHATVTATHTRTDDLKKALEHADVVMVAIGDPEFITDKHLKPNQIVIDVGINFVDGKLVGDVDSKVVMGKVKALSAVPGGVGVLTTAVIFKNLIKAIKLQNI